MTRRLTKVEIQEGIRRYGFSDDAAWGIVDSIFDPLDAAEIRPDFRDGVEHVYDVKVAAAIGLIFDEPPTEHELRRAMLENFIDKVTSSFYDWEDDDIEYELLDVTDSNTEVTK